MKLKNKGSSKITATSRISSSSTDRKARTTRDTSKNSSRGKKLALIILGVLIVVALLLTLSINSFALGTTPALHTENYIVGNVYTSGGNYTTAYSPDNEYTYVTNKNGSASTRAPTVTNILGREFLLSTLPVYSESALHVEIPVHSYYPYLRTQGLLEPDSNDPVTKIMWTTNHSTPVTVDVHFNYYTALPTDENLATQIAFGYYITYTTTLQVDKTAYDELAQLVHLLPDEATYLESIVLAPHVTDFTGTSVTNNSLVVASTDFSRFAYTSYMMDSYSWLNDSENALNKAYSQGYNRGLSEDVDAGWFAEAVDSILGIELFQYDTGNVILSFTLGTIFMVTLGATALIWILRMFAGG